MIRNRNELRHDTDAKDIGTTTGVQGEPMTKQSFRDDCDVNLIVRRHAQTGMWSHLNPRQPHYGDFSEATSLQAAFDLVENAELSFLELPAAVRQAADNDPVKFIEMGATEEGFRALVEAGLPTDAKLPEDPPAKPAEPPAEPTP